MAVRSNMAAILPVNDMPKWRFTIYGCFLYENALKVILNMSGQYQLLRQGSTNYCVKMTIASKWLPFSTKI